MDPQQRLFLQAVWHALDMPVMPPAPSPIRPAFSPLPDEYLPRSRSIERDRSRAGKGLQSLMGNDKDYIATRAAYKLTCTVRRYRYRPPVPVRWLPSSGL